MAKWDVHRNLYGGVGMIITKTVRILGVKIIRFDLDPESTIGHHFHNAERELYISFDKNVRLNGNADWKMMSFCRKGCAHSAQNISQTIAKLWAIKF